jgi:hypothetical protein
MVGLQPQILNLCKQRFGGVEHAPLQKALVAVELGVTQAQAASWYGYSQGAVSAAIKRVKKGVSLEGAGALKNKINNAEDRRHTITRAEVTEWMRSRSVGGSWAWPADERQWNLVFVAVCVYVFNLSDDVQIAAMIYKSKVTAYKLRQQALNTFSHSRFQQ